MLVLLAIACGSWEAAADPAASPPPPDDTYFGGPFADIKAVLRTCYRTRDDVKPTSTTLAEKRAPGGVIVSLREYRTLPSSAGCAVTIQTPAGIYVGPEFLCSADRSDERIITKRVTIATTATAATLRFTVSYQHLEMFDPAHNGVPHASDHVIRCTFGRERPTCTPPPTMGYGYDHCDLQGRRD
jgi:hypothetical protein